MSALLAPLSTRARDAQDKARVLREALPWMTRWAGRTVVVKYGGNAVTDDGLASFAADVALLHSVGLRVVVVHGGGPQISALSDRLGLSHRFVDGLRVTDAETLDVVKMVLLGQVNPRIVGAIAAEGASAVGVSGTDGTLLTVRPADPRLGYVGEVTAVNPRVLTALLEQGAVPVVAPLGRGAHGEYNVNADTVAGAVAVALGADKLIYLTNVAGLYESFGLDDAEPSLLSHVTLERLRGMLADGALHDGMVPKIASVVSALDGGVAHAHLLDGRVEHALLLEIFTDSGIGTMIDPFSSDAPLEFTGIEEKGSNRQAGGTVSVDTMTATAALAAREAAALLPTYRRHPLAFVAGEGPWLIDAEGGRYLDFLSGLAVTSLGHAHPAVTAAVAGQAARLTHVSNLFLTEPQVALAERLASLLGWADGRSFLCNSGAEANEAAVKLARRHGLAQAPGKVKVVALEGGFHGRLLAALLLTGNPAKHAPFQPLGDWVTHVPHDDPAALEAAVDDDTCAVWLEVVQGEGGVRPLSPAMLAAARTACDRVGALLVADEVQTGVGRLGAWFGWQTTAIEPDVVCLAKALANGLPIGAIVARGVAAEAFQPGDHASTFGGGPVVCAAALAVLDTLESEGLVANAARVGRVLEERLDELVARSDLAAGHRGRGLLQALVLTAPLAARVEAAARDEGLIVNAVAPDAIRLAPPLNVDAGLVGEAARRLGRALDRVGAEVAP